MTINFILFDSFACLYKSTTTVFDWLDLKMLESIVLVLPSDWFSLSAWRTETKSRLLPT